MMTSAMIATERYAGQYTLEIAVRSPLRDERKGQPDGPNSTLRLRSAIRTTSRRTMLAHAARTIHFDAMPMPSTVPRATSESIDALNDLLWMWTRNKKYEARMKKIGKMSIIPMRDWMKNIPSKHTSVAAASAKILLGNRRLPRRYIIGTHRVPKRQAAMRHPNVLKPRSM